MRRLRAWFWKPWTDELMRVRREIADFKLYREDVASGHVRVEHRSDGVLIRTAAAGVLIPPSKVEAVAKELWFRRPTPSGSSQTQEERADG